MAKDPQTTIRAPRRATKADLLEGKQPRTIEVAIALDEVASREYEDAVEALEQEANGTRKDAEARVKAAASALDAVTVVAVLRSIGGRRYDELVDAHSPTEAQKKEAREVGVSVAFNTDTFPVALIAASLAEPELALEEVQQLWDEWNRGERMQFFNAALDVNTRSRRVAELGKGSG